MNYRITTTSWLSKVIGSIMTIAVSLFAFAYAQNCSLLPTRSPYTTLADGHSRTWYSIPEATYTQSCHESLGTITCVSGSVAYGDTYKYASCIPHTWTGCTTPTVANHLDFKVLYKAASATYTQSCQQLSQNLQCLNGVFTGVPNASLYSFASCTDPNRAQCVDVRTNSYRDHGEIIIGYAGTTPGIGQTCATQKRTLTCYNGTRSGNGTFGQVGISTWCTDPSYFTGCVNTRVSPAITVPHNSSLNAYTSPTSLGAGTCANVLKPLTCINGVWSGNGLAQQAGLYSGCTQANTASCANIIDGTGSVLNGSFATVFTDNLRMQTNNESCSDVDITIQCVNGTRSWYNPSLHYTKCQNVESGACYDNLSDRYIPHLQSIFVYTGSAPTEEFWCNSVRMAVTCNVGKRHKFTWSGPLIGTTFPTTSYFANCAGCTTPWGATLAEWSSIISYSFTGVDFPKSCNQYSTTLSCSGGVLQGNRQTYRYTGCNVSGGLVPGVDISIDKSPVRTNNYPIAQWSSPELSIIFYNNGLSWVDTYDLPSGFLSCNRLDPDNNINVNVYNSNIVSQFSVPSATKLGVNIRIKTIFTQATGKKTMVCKINPSLLWTAGDIAANNIWTGKFEIVEAERFDLALSRSIEGISENLEAAEGATGTQGLQNFLYNKIMNVLVPLIIILGILSAILGFYKLMFSSDDKAVQEGTRYIIFGVIGIILIMSTKFIGQNVFDMLSANEIVGKTMAKDLYEKIIFPFIKFAIYLVLGAMFVILVGRVITFIFGKDADTVKKAWTLIARNVISMLVIIGAKQIVEVIYGAQDKVVNENITNLWEIGTGILASKNIPILYQIINYALGIVSLVMLVIIIIQTVKLLMKPDDPAQVKSIKNSLVYMFIGILILGAGYLIVNFAILN